MRITLLKLYPSVSLPCALASAFCLLQSLNLATAHFNSHTSVRLDLFYMHICFPLTGCIFAVGQPSFVCL